MVGLLTLTACTDLRGPSVPAQPGQTLETARQAVFACAPRAAQGGQNAVTGSYVTGILFGGILPGIIIAASNEEITRAHGEASAVDKCLAERGFQRRDLTAQEVQALNNSSGYARKRLLDHLVGGGSLATFRVPSI
ncbi:MAG: hypothetical protein HKP51_05655 [Sulfitobacter sp.]|nr:hypothetical protein [Sulfitobacter sp.]